MAEVSQRNKINIEESNKVIQKVDSLLSKPKIPTRPSRAMYFDKNIPSFKEFKRFNKPSRAMYFRDDIPTFKK